MRRNIRIIGPMDYRTQLITLAEEYGRCTGLSEARIATLAQNTGVFFRRIREGKGCSVDTYLKVKEWFAGHWPADLAWPEGVDRPDILPTQSAPNGDRGRTGRRSTHPEGRAA